MNLIVGLGNHQQIYAKTRHNIGWMLIDYIAEQFNEEFMEFHSDDPKMLRIKRAADHYAMEYYHIHKRSSINSMEDNVVTYYFIHNNNIYMKPALGMNSSGEAVAYVKNLYPEIESILVVCDDTDLPKYTPRLKRVNNPRHNGVKSVMKQLGVSQIDLLRIGVGTPPKNCRLLDFVLGDFKKDEAQVIHDTVLKTVFEVVEDYNQTDMDHAIECLNQLVHKPM